MKRFFASLVAVVMALILVTPVSAITEAQLNMFAQNNILFYDPNGANCSYTGGMTSTNANYAGAEVWSAAELQAVQANQAIYEEAANQYGFPWQILAVLHKKGYNLQKSSEDEFRQQMMAEAVNVNSKAVGLDLNSANGIKKMFFRYNREATEYINKALAMGFTQSQANNGEGSPYVMNRFDDRRDPTSTSMSSLWPGRYEESGQYVEGSTSYQFGAYVLYLALGGNGGMYCNGGLGGTIFEVAMSLAKLGGSNGTGWYINGDKVPTDAYRRALSTYNARPTGYADWYENPGASCDQFVATVMISSGLDPNFPDLYPPTQRRYMLNHPEKYQQITNTRDFSILQPGDILVSLGENKGERHIFIYGGERDGVPVQIGASNGIHTAYVYKFSDSTWVIGGYEYLIFRMIQ